MSKPIPGGAESDNYPYAALDTPKPSRAIGNSEAEERAMGKVGEWWDMDHVAKAAIQAEFDEVDRQFRGDHWNMRDHAGNVLRSDEQKASKPNTVENHSLLLIESIKAEFAREVEFIDKPREPNDDEAARQMTKLKAHLLEKNNFRSEYARYRHWFFWHGTGIWGPRWDPDWITGQGPSRAVGDIRTEAVDPRLLFPDSRCGSDIQSGWRIHKVAYRPLEYIRERYPQRAHLVEETSDDAGVQGEAGPGVPDSERGMGLVFETWYKGEPLLGKSDGNGLHVIWWADEARRIYLRHENYVFFEPDSSVEFPFVFAQCYPRENSPWGYGEAYMLKNQQLAINALSELALMGTALQALGQTYVEEGAISEDQQDVIDEQGGLPGVFFWITRVEGIKHIPGAGIPASLLADRDYRQRVMESIVGRHDVTQGKTPGSVTAFRALKLLSEQAMTRLQGKSESLEEGLRGLSRWMGRFITLFYNEERRFRVLGEDGKPQFATFKPALLERAWDKQTSNVVEADRFQPLPGMEEGRDYEYFSAEFDATVTVGRAVPMDRLMSLEMAKEMLGAQPPLINPRIFWKVMADGRFPPWESVSSEMGQLFQQAQAMQQQPPPGGMPPGMPQPPGQMQLPPEIIEQLASMPPDEREQVLAAMAQELGWR